MSIKIYNGYIFDKNYSLSELARICNEIRTIVLNDTKKMMLKNINVRNEHLKDIFKYQKELDISEEKMDSIILKYIGIKKEEKDIFITDKNDFFFLISDMIGDKMKLHQINSKYPYFDYNFDIIIYPLEDKILATIHCQDYFFKETINKLFWLKSYYYFNNTDELLDISQEEWTQREIDWKKVIKDGKSFEGSGLTLKCNTEYELLLLPQFVTDDMKLSINERKSNLIQLFPEKENIINNLIFN